MTFSLKGLKTITNYQYEPACGILSLLDILFVEATRRVSKVEREKQNCRYPDGILVL